MIAGRRWRWPRGLLVAVVCPILCAAAICLSSGGCTAIGEPAGKTLDPYSSSMEDFRNEKEKANRPLGSFFRRVPPKPATSVEEFMRSPRLDP